MVRSSRASAPDATCAQATHRPHEALIGRLCDRIEATLDPLLSGARAAALLDFPSYSNVGDNAIWLGELTYLRTRTNLSVTYTCDAETYSRAELARHLRGGMILLSGGGNLGDLWARYQALRERVIGDFPDTAIVQLPQSIHFQDRRALQRARDIFDGHPKLTLLVRDRPSLALARQEFRTPSQLCPDMAFCLGALDRPCSPSTDIVWLARTDKESTRPSLAHAGGIEPVDWLEEPVTWLHRLYRLAQRPRLSYSRRWGVVVRARSRVAEQLARQRLARGCRLLAAGRTVITDRLHGHVLSVLLGIPHLLLDNSTGKIRSFYDTWTSALPLVHWCQTPAEALSRARAIATSGEPTVSHRGVGVDHDG